VALAALSRPRRVIRFRLGAWRLFFLRTMEMIIFGFDPRHQTAVVGLERRRAAEPPR
jgi:hypothetical protein